MVKKYSVVFLLCFVFAFCGTCIYPVKRDLFLGIKNIFYSETVISPKEIISVNYKRTQDDGSFFTVSKPRPLFVIRIDDKYVGYLTIKFKEPLQDKLDFNIYIEKEYTLPVIKVENINNFSNKIYTMDLNERIQNIIVKLGKQEGDSFSLDAITYLGSSKYYFNQIIHYNYFAQLKLKSFWIRLIKIFGIFIILFLIFEIFYRYEIYIRKKRKQK